MKASSKRSEPSPESQVIPTVQEPGTTPAEVFDGCRFLRIRGETLFSTPVPCPSPGRINVPYHYVNDLETPGLDFRFYPQLGLATMQWPVDEDGYYEPQGARMSKPVIIFSSAISSIQLW